VSGQHRPCEFCAVRALKGEQAGLVVGMTFVPIGALESMRWGKRDDPGSLLPAAVAAAGLDFAFVSAKDPWAERTLEGILESGAAPLWVVDGALANAFAVHGWTEALRLTAADSAALTPALDEGAALAVSEALRGLAAGAAGVVVAEDLAGAQGPLVAPDFANEELLPRAASIVVEASRVQLPSIFHSDGDIRVFLPGIARAGFSAVHGGGMGDDAFVRMLRDARAHNLRVIGGIEGVALRKSVPSAIRAGVQAALFAAPGDLLVADDGSIATSEELSAFLSAVGAARGGRGER
jgi:hypothetical protein